MGRWSAATRPPYHFCESDGVLHVIFAGTLFPSVWHGYNHIGSSGKQLLKKGGGLLQMFEDLEAEDEIIDPVRGPGEEIGNDMLNTWGGFDSDFIQRHTLFGGGEGLQNGRTAGAYV